MAECIVRDSFRLADTPIAPLVGAILLLFMRLCSVGATFNSRRDRVIIRSWKLIAD
jgi:hypothetical protein